MLFVYIYLFIWGGREGSKNNTLPITVSLSVNHFLIIL